MSYAYFDVEGKLYLWEKDLGGASYYFIWDWYYSCEFSIAEIDCNVSSSFCFNNIPVMC
jgi:hypothetical protein